MLFESLLGAVGVRFAVDLLIITSIKVSPADTEMFVRV